MPKELTSEEIYLLRDLYRLEITGVSTMVDVFTALSQKINRSLIDPKYRLKDSFPKSVLIHELNKSVQIAQIFLDINGGSEFDPEMNKVLLNWLTVTYFYLERCLYLPEKNRVDEYITDLHLEIEGFKSLHITTPTELDRVNNVVKMVLKGLRSKKKS